MGIQPTYCNLNTSYVDIKLNKWHNVVVTYADLNTSYVDIKPDSDNSFVKSFTFKYILC